MSIEQQTAVLTLEVEEEEQESLDSAATACAAPVDSQERPTAESDSQPQRFATGIDWITAGWIGLVHLGALAAPSCFTWKGLALVPLFIWLTGGIGICLGFHRLFTHQSFSTSRPVRWLIAWLGGLAGQGSVIHWVANHRKHHALSDHEGDPHTPVDGGLWAHMTWLFPKEPAAELAALHRRWAPDLLKDPVLRLLDATFIVWHLLLGGLMFLVGWYFWDTYTGWSFVVYGMFVRMVWCMHSTWLVNSATHMWGYRNYATDDHSRNLWWVALLTFGEGWHNNHHAHPRMACNGHRWWEFDMTYRTIWLMEKLGIFTDVAHQSYNRRLADAESRPPTAP